MDKKKDAKDKLDEIKKAGFSVISHVKEEITSPDGEKLGEVERPLTFEDSIKLLEEDAKNDPAHILMGVVAKNLRSRVTEPYAPQKWAGEEQCYNLVMSSAEQKDKNVLIRTNYTGLVKPHVTLMAPKSLMTRWDLVSIVKDLTEPKEFKVEDCLHWNVEKQCKEPLPSWQVSKYDVKSEFSDMIGKSVLNISDMSSYSHGVFDENGNRIYFPHESLCLSSNQFEFNPDEYRDTPEVINTEVVKEIEGILFDVADKVLGEVDYVIFSPTAWKAPSVDKVASKYGEPERLEIEDNSFYGFKDVALYRFTVPNEEAEDLILIEDRQNTGYAIPFTYTRVLKFNEPVDIKHIRDKIDKELSIF
jgi:hypothetical protein